MFHRILSSVHIVYHITISPSCFIMPRHVSSPASCPEPFIMFMSFSIQFKPFNNCPWLLMMSNMCYHISYCSSTFHCFHSASCFTSSLILNAFEHCCASFIAFAIFHHFHHLLMFHTFLSVSIIFHASHHFLTNYMVCRWGSALRLPPSPN